MAMPRQVIQRASHPVFKTMLFGKEDFIQTVRNIGSGKYLTKAIIKGVMKGIAIVQNETVKQVTTGSNRAILSGFMRASVNTAVEALGVYRAKGYIFTSAFYDIYVHEGLGIHADPPYSKPVPDEYKPSQTQLSMIPSNIRALQKALLAHKGKKKKGPRPFFREAFMKSIEKVRAVILKELQEGFLYSIKYSPAMRTMNARARRIGLK